MKQLNTLEYLRLNKIQRLIYKIQEFFCAIPGRTVSFFKKLGKKILDFFTDMPEARLFDNIIQRHIIYSSPRFSLFIFPANAAGALQNPSSLERIA